MKKFISWNVNGIRACVKKGFMETFKELDADIFCIQETKLQDGQIDLDLEGYHQYWNYAEKKGYSGTAIFTKKKPINVSYGINNEIHDKEGRVITLEFDDFIILTCYTPNSQRGLKRLDYRMDWEKEFKNYCEIISKKKPLIICGDLNVAHKEIDLKNPKTNKKNAGFTNEEREKIDFLLKDFLVDSYRVIYPNKENAYTWWSYMNNSRINNTGWRIDYFLLTNNIKNNLEEAYIFPDYLGSDHCPIGVLIDI
ncbi:MAG: exodeoxyribonuclease III [Clostridiales bacterium]